jgi:hypothetical protein
MALFFTNSCYSRRMLETFSVNQIHLTALRAVRLDKQLSAFIGNIFEKEENAMSESEELANVS